MTDKEAVLHKKLCDTLRSAYHSSLYYENRLWWANFWNFTFEIAIAIGATGSSVAAWALWKQGIGVYVWAVITGSSTLLALLKPIVAPGKRLEHRTKQHQGWYSLFFSAERLILTVRGDNAFARDSQKALDVLIGRESSLHLEDEKCPNRRLLRRLERAVSLAITPADLCPVGASTEAEDEEDRRSLLPTTPEALPAADDARQPDRTQRPVRAV